MELHEELASKFADAMMTAINLVLDLRRQGMLADEDDFTSQMLAHMRIQIGHLKSVQGATWEAATDSEPYDLDLKGRKLTSRGAAAEERKFGADMVFVLDVRLREVGFSKGLIVQAKNVNASGNVPRRDEFQRLQGQCRTMLTFTPASFVLGYGPANVVATSASQVASGQPISASRYSPRVVFHDFFRCWIGDHRINAVDRRALGGLREQYDAKAAMLVSLRKGEKEREPQPRVRRLNLGRKFLDG